MALVETAAINNTASLKEEPVSVGENDVLFGRGGATNNWTGNRKFRVLVQKHQEEYLLAKKTDKKAIAVSIVNEIHRNGGRFLKRVDESDGNKNSSGVNDNSIEHTHQWVEVTFKRACEKASQALREGLDVRTKEKGTHESDESHVVHPNKKRKKANDEHDEDTNHKSEGSASPTPVEVNSANALLQKLSQLQNSLPSLGESLSNNEGESAGSTSMNNKNAEPIIQNDSDVVEV